MFSTVWVEAYDELQDSWKFGVIPCKLQYMWQWLTMNCSIWTLAALSIDRYMYLWCNFMLCILVASKNLWRIVL